MPHRIFVAGGTGYIGSRLIPLLIARGHHVTALVRAGSEEKAKTRCEIYLGNALEGDSFGAQLKKYDTFIHLVGVPHPSPSKARDFVAVDLRSGEEAIRVASSAGIRHFIYISVAQPAPVMEAYIKVRAVCEAALRASGLPATILRPWYVLGPGHRWPLLLKPLYSAAELLPATREGARRLGLVTLGQMINTLAAVAEDPPSGVRVFEVAQIRSLGEAFPKCAEESAAKLGPASETRSTPIT